VLTKVTALKNEGNKCFAKRDYESALEQYETAAQLLPEAAPERVDLICNRAACYYQMKRWVAGRGTRKQACRDRAHTGSASPRSRRRERAWRTCCWKARSQ
jgi:tetratricopeptide (TPR) repeat protein